MRVRNFVQALSDRLKFYYPLTLNMQPFMALATFAFSHFPGDINGLSSCRQVKKVPVMFPIKPFTTDAGRACVNVERVRHARCTLATETPNRNQKGGRDKELKTGRPIDTGTLSVCLIPVCCPHLKHIVAILSACLLLCEQTTDGVVLTEAVMATASWNLY